MVHDLKILTSWFYEIKSGIKTFEIRKNDRDYKVGDILVLREWSTFNGGEYSGDYVEALVTYITDFAQKDNYVVLGIRIKEESK